MEHVTSQRLVGDSVRPDITSGVGAAGRAVARFASWLASDSIGGRLERQYEYDAQMLRRYDRRSAR